MIISVFQVNIDKREQFTSGHIYQQKGKNGAARRLGGEQQRRNYSKFSTVNWVKRLHFMADRAGHLVHLERPCVYKCLKQFLTSLHAKKVQK
ncbi:hypothetical protein P3S68_015616 [Capsicum galapagoense]